MKNTKPIRIVLFTMFSIVISSVIALYGLSLSFGGEMPLWVHGIAMYGIGALFMLSLAFSKFSQYVRTGINVVTIIPIAIFIYASLDLGLAYILGWNILITAGLSVICNLYLIISVSKANNPV